MTYLISFYSNTFDIGDERESTINPIKGFSVGEWLNSILENKGIETTEIDEEDWGWYSYAFVDSQKYLIGFISIPEETNGNLAEIIIQINKERSFFEKLSGKNKISHNDHLIKVISEVITQSNDFQDIKEEIKA